MSRRIEEALAVCLEQMESGNLSPEEALLLYPEFQSELEPMLHLQSELRALPRVEAPARLRGYKRPVFHPRPAREAWWQRILPAGGRSLGWATPLAQAAAALAVLFVAGGGAVVASANSLPDEPLYPVKLAVENAQLTLAPTDHARAELELHFASKRLAEVENAAQQGRTDAVAKGADLYREKVDAAVKASRSTPDSPQPEVEDAVRQNQEALTRVLAKVQDTKSENSNAENAILHAMDASSKAVGPKQDSERDKSNNRDGEKNGKPNEKVATAAPAPVSTSIAASPTPTAAPTATPAPATTPDTHEPQGKAKGQTEQPGNSGQGNPQGQEQREQGQPPKPVVTPQDAPQATPTATHTAPPGQRKGQGSDEAPRSNAPQKSGADSSEDDPDANGQKKGNDRGKANQKDFLTTIVENIQKLVGARK